MNPFKAEFIELFHRTGWTQTECARRLEVTKASVNQYVTGDAVPSASILKLLRLIVALEIDTPPTPAAAQLKEKSLPYQVTPEAQSLAAEINELPPELQDAVVPALRQIVGTYQRRKKRR